MSGGGTPEQYMRKAERALNSARSLLHVKDTEGACNRAYYAMFDAAQAALRAAGVVSLDAEIKTHHGLLVLFSRELVKAGHVDVVHSKTLNQAQDIRLKADYTTEPPTLEETAWAVAQAEAFVLAMRAKFGA